jgi:ACS family pantothenate transporter-like MFS transporter
MGPGNYPEELRAAVYARATGNIFTYTFMAHYKYGYQLLIIFGALAIVGVYLFGWLDE